MNPTLLLVLEASLRAAALAAAVGSVLAAMRIRSGAIRHAAWTAVLSAMPLMFLLPRVTPPVPVPFFEASIPATPLPALAEPSAPPPVPAVRTLSALQAAAAAPLAIAVPLPAPRLSWRAEAGFALYGIVLAFLLLRAAMGWRASRRILRSAEPARAASALHGLPPTDEPLAVLQSGLIATPLTIGICKPRIVLPLAWREWPEATQRAVLAHEAEHVRRRDSLVSFAAHLNRCAFWFHPLAWWLERQLAIAAEHACDETAVRTTGEGPGYARILVDLAETVRRAGGRLAWHGLGIHGAGALEERIARILRGEPSRPVSNARKSAVAAACGAALFLAAACQPSRQTLVARAEARDKAEKEQLAAATAFRKPEADLRAAADKLTPDQIAAMEALLAKSPDDYETRRKLLAYYMFTAPRRETSGVNVSGPVALQRLRTAREADNAAIRRHTLWMVAHHPEDDLASPPLPLTFAGIGAAASEWEEARRLWLAQADRDGQPVAVYLHAAAFFVYVDPPEAEKLYLRARAADPKGACFGPAGPYSLTWARVLGGFYANAYSVYAPTSRFAAAQAPQQDKVVFLAKVQRTLDASNDVQLLLNAANMLVGLHRPHDANNVSGVDAFAVGKEVLQRAMQLDPDSTWGRQLLTKVHDQEILAALPDEVWEGPYEARHQAILALPEGDRFRELALLAIAAANEALRAQRLKNVDAADFALWQQAGAYAKEAMDMANSARTDPDYGTALYDANLVLGMAALNSGDPQTAGKYLLAAAGAPATDELRYPMAGLRPWGTEWQIDNPLAKSLLTVGERDVVAKFLDRYANLCVTQREKLLEEAALIRSGRNPHWSGM
ncbi:MAG TPA: M56 family metallopeptidase [Bryobacteraceae bacterium]|nr:M56 family metallopeptidase [Bryobacteraceae bacterium]